MKSLKATFRKLTTIIVCYLLLLSCVEEEEKTTADVFIGIYSISVTEQVIWGNDSGTLTDTGTLSITKISDTKVRASGFINTIGEIANSAIYFEPIQASDSYGYLTTTFSPVILSGNVLTMTATSTGQLATTANGVLYPFRSTQQIHGIKY